MMPCPYWISTPVNPVIPDVMPVVEQNRLLDGFVLVGRVWGASPSEQEEDGTDPAQHRRREGKPDDHIGRRRE
jgi:hypothetical protein